MSEQDAPQTAPTALTPENIGSVLGVSTPQSFSQATINEYAKITHDLQWIHVDPKRAANGPYGTTIAHGYLVLSLLPFFARTVINASTSLTLINYGLDRVRFVGAARVDTPIVDEVRLSSISQRESGLLVGLSHEIREAESGTVLCVAETLSVYQGIA